MITLSSSRSLNRYHVRSVSFPGRSHPCTNKIEQVLNKIKTWDSPFSSSSSLSSPKPEKVYELLPMLVELYECIEQLLALPITQSHLFQHHQDTSVDGLLEGSVRFIDICSSTREMVVMSKEAIHELQSVFRRNKVGDHLNIESGIDSYDRSRRKMHKEIEKTLTVLKQVDNGAVSRSDSPIIRVLEEASLVSVSTFESLLMFLSSVPFLKPKPSRWSLASKLMRQKGVLTNYHHGKKDNNLSDMEKVDLALGDLILHKCDKEGGGAEKLELAQRRLETLDIKSEILEHGLEELFKHMIRIRVSLLNHISE
ncbi:unnamed protein product [Cuscuta campestris]|uniref:DUF241 domain-containing protein n=1 Tax=Cuscuta campestris TaxID=132261 RepID=A0A484MJD1_9ASTE|nr:unnamed protein product [Cuscuta campestris]